MTAVSCLVLWPFFQFRYTTSLPLPSSSHASILSISSSHDPEGGVHFFVAGGLVSFGCVADLRDRFVPAP
jgi:hypothetical protein